MKISLQRQIAIDPTLPAGPLRGFTDSAVLAELCGVPDMLGGGAVQSVAVSLVTPDGMPVTGQAFRVGREYHALFAASNFVGYGQTRRGFRAVATILREDGTTFPLVLGVGNLEIFAGAPDASPGDPSDAYVLKGSDVYFKSRVVDGVQHYVKQEMEYDAEIGWGANWTGDYILVNGEYVAASGSEVP